jgi:hypothetical protein
MGKRVLIIFVIVVLVAAVAGFLFWEYSQREIARVCFIAAEGGDACFDVEVVRKEDDRAKGLMFRDSITKETGMLFVFEERARHSFWMKNTFVALDIIWIDVSGDGSDGDVMNHRGEVVDIWHGAEPCKEGEMCSTITPSMESNYVLEIRGGMAEEIGIGIGDNVDIGFG